MLLPGEEGGLRVSAMRLLLQLGLSARNLAEHIEFRNTPPIPPLDTCIFQPPWECSRAA